MLVHQRVIKSIFASITGGCELCLTKVTVVKIFVGSWLGHQYSNAFVHGPSNTSRCATTEKTSQQHSVKSLPVYVFWFISFTRFIFHSCGHVCHDELGFPPISWVLRVHKPLAQETNAEDETRKSGAPCRFFSPLRWNSPVFVLDLSRNERIQNDPNIYPLVMTNIAIEHGPFIDGLPIKNCDFPWLC